MSTIIVAVDSWWHWLPFCFKMVTQSTRLGDKLTRSREMVASLTHAAPHSKTAAVGAVSAGVQPYRYCLLAMKGSISSCFWRKNISSAVFEWGAVCVRDATISLDRVSLSPKRVLWVTVLKQNGSQCHQESTATIIVDIAWSVTVQFARKSDDTILAKKGRSEFA